MLAELRARIGRLIAHRRAIKSLRSDEASWRALFSNASDAILIADEAGRYVEANAAACTLLHRSREQITGHRVADLLTATERDRLGDPRDEARRGGRQVREWTMSLGDGGQVAVEVSDRILSDGRWIAYTKQLPSHLYAVFVYSVESGRSTQITDGLSDARYPAFDKNGKYLYFTASTNAGPVGVARL